MAARLRIVADRNIPYLAEAFAALGEVIALGSSELDASAVRDADLVLVRSTVKVDEALLGASRARFVATATIGTDHLDLPWLASRGIAVASAPGSNADSVAQWWASALLTLGELRRVTFAGSTVGVVGVGNIGRRVEQLATALGCHVLRCDPPRARAEGGDFLPLETLLAASDIVTFHVPLERLNGADPTWHLLDGARLGLLRPGAIVINASRGPVVDNAAAVAARAAGQVGALLLDVFEREPDVDPAVIAACDLATPHIAGHSLDGKANGTRMIYEAACRHLGVAAKWTPRRALPPPPVRVLAVDARDLGDEAAALMVLRRFYRIEDDDAALRRIAGLATDRGAAFQQYRASYPIRRELHGLRLQMMPPRPRARALLAALGAVDGEVT